MLVNELTGCGFESRCSNLTPQNVWNVSNKTFSKPTLGIGITLNKMFFYNEDVGVMRPFVPLFVKHYFLKTLRRLSKNLVRLWIGSIIQAISVFLEISQNSQENTYARVFFNKVASMRPATSIKKRLWHRCFPVNFEGTVFTKPIILNIKMY